MNAVKYITLFVTELQLETDLQYILNKYAE